MYNVPANFINEDEIRRVISQHTETDKIFAGEILSKAKELNGLELNEVAALVNINDPGLISELFESANYVKETIYGKRLVIFAPLYVSNLC